MHYIFKALSQDISTGSSIEFCHAIYPEIALVRDKIAIVNLEDEKSRLPLSYENENVLL